MKTIETSTATDNHQPDNRSGYYLTVIRGSDAGLIFPVPLGPFQIGRGENNTLSLNDSQVSRNHLTAEFSGNRLLVKDNDSTNGIFVNEMRITRENMEVGDILRAGDSLMKFEKLFAFEVEYRQLQNKKATKDSLTRLNNRETVMSALENHFNICLRYNRDFALLLIDLDHFKQINDTHGHPAGDFIIASFGFLLKEVPRKEDITGRIGGEEFMVILPETSIEGATIMAERIRSFSEKLKPRHSGETEIPFTISCGITTFQSKKFKSIDEMYEAADRALYKAKQNGRNRVEIFAKSSDD